MILSAEQGAGRLEYQTVIVAIIAAASGFLGGNGFKTLIDFLTQRKVLDQAAKDKAAATLSTA